MASALVQDDTPQRKRRRLNHACDLCRSRKVRCDDRQPDCTNCFKANKRCMTRDLRNPSSLVVRHEAQAQQDLSIDSRTSLHNDESRGTPTHAGSAANLSPVQDYGPSTSLRHVPPLSRAGHRQSVSNIDHEASGSLASKTPGTEIETEVHPPGQGLAVARLPIFPRFVNGNSLYILTQWLDLAFARLNHSFRFSHLCREARGQVEQDSASDVDVDQVLSDVPSADAIVTNFLHSIHQMFPLLDVAYWSNLVHETNPQLPVRRILRALLVAVECGPSSRKSLNNAFSQLSVLVQATTLESLITLILMVIAFRGHDDAETAVRVLSLASTVANMMGLQQCSNFHTSHEIVAWWTLFTLDKILAIELERPALIRSRDCTQKAVDANTLLHHLVDLGKVQESIIEKMFQQRGMEESNERTLEEIILQKLKTASELDTLLVEWQANLPYDIRVSDYLLCDNDNLPAASFLAIQFHQTLLSVHRNSLITNTQHIRHAANTHFRGSPFRLRLWNGSRLCYNSAKFIVTTLAQLRDNHQNLICSTTYSALIAAIVLAIYIYKYSTGVTVRADLELLTFAVDCIEQRSILNSSTTHADTLSKLLRSLLADLAARVDNSRLSPVTRLPQIHVPEPPSEPPRTQDQPQAVQGNEMPAAGDTRNAFQNTAAELFEQSDDNFPFNNAIDIDWSTSDIAHWPEFLQMLDLSGQHLTNS